MTTDATTSSASSASALLAEDACGQAAALRAGEISPRELAEAALSRISETDPECWAISWLRSEEALSEAEATDPRTESAPAFAGVPTLLKDHRCQATGQETRFGTTALADTRKPWGEDSNVYRSLADQGFIVLGRTTTPEFATALLTESVATGITRNPHKPTHVSGGSSGGSAAAVAAGMVPVAHATDGGGSIRVPASCVGIVGLKPTRGRVSLGPHGGGESWGGATVEGVLSRTVRDTAAVTAGMARRFPGDIYVAPDQVSAEVQPPPRLRIGVMGQAPDGTAWHPEVERVLSETAEALDQRGHHVAASHPAALSEAAEVSDRFDLMITVDAELLIRRIESQLGRSLDPHEIAPRNVARRERALSTNAAEYLDTRYWLNEWSGRLQSWWEGDDSAAGEGWDVLLLPTLGGLPAPAGQEKDLREAGDLDASMMKRTAEMRPMTNFFNVSGLPAISLPLGKTTEGLPIGMQFAARLGEERTLLSLAAECEKYGPWHVAQPFG